MEEEILDPQTSMRQIEVMISAARNQLSENGHLYLFWGWLVFVCSLFQFVATQFAIIQQPYRVWWLMLPALLYQAIYLYRKKSRARVKTYADRLLGAVWLVFIVMMGILWYTLVFNGQYQIYYSLLLMLYAMPAILSGVILKIKSLVFGGIAAMVMSVVSNHLPPAYQLLMISAAVLVAWIIPGYQIQGRFKRQQAQHKLYSN